MAALGADSWCSVFANMPCCVKFSYAEISAYIVFELEDFVLLYSDTVLHAAQQSED